MKVADLVEERICPWGRKLCEGRVIALDGMDDKVLFDTWKNRTYIKKYFSGEVVALWADVCVETSYPTSVIRPCIKCYVKHDSWKGGEE